MNNLTYVGSEIPYVGSELEKAALALNWKAYFGRLLFKYVGGDVLEVGAGMGSTTLSLCKCNHKRWVCLEPDPELAKKIAALRESRELPGSFDIRVGTLEDLDEHEKFDTITYIDVLEHIEDDAREARAAADRLRRGGHLIVLSPAYPALYTPFDAGIGHYRRYTRQSLSRVVPDDLKVRELFYADSIGAIATLSNRYVLKSAMPSRLQVLFWDRVLVRLSRLFDPLFLYRIGKTVIGVWQKT